MCDILTQHSKQQHSKCYCLLYCCCSTLFITCFKYYFICALLALQLLHRTILDIVGSSASVCMGGIFILWASCSEMILELIIAAIAYGSCGTTCLMTAGAAVLRTAEDNAVDCVPLGSLTVENHSCLRQSFRPFYKTVDCNTQLQKCQEELMSMIK